MVHRALETQYSYGLDCDRLDGLAQNLAMVRVALLDIAAHSGEAKREVLWELAFGVRHVEQDVSHRLTAARQAQIEGDPTESASDDDTDGDHWYDDDSYSADSDGDDGHGDRDGDHAMADADTGRDTS